MSESYDSTIVPKYPDADAGISCPIYSNLVHRARRWQSEVHSCQTTAAGNGI
jgi:hypothetical protein